MLAENQNPVALIQGGLNAEKEVSLLSAKAVAKVFKSLNISYYVLECGTDIAQKLAKLKPACAFLAVHGQYAEDGTLQGICEYLKIPYTGSGVLASALCMDKCFFKDYISQAKIPTPGYQNLCLGAKAFVDFNRSHFSIEKAFGIKIPLPFVVKPSRAGSTLGISICKALPDVWPALKKASQYDHKILIESYIEGPEWAFSFFKGRVLTPVEVVAEGGFYDYDSKYLSQKTQYILPPRVDGAVLKEAHRIAKKAFEVTKVKTYARADFIIDSHKQPLITEINTLPGLTTHSLLPKSAEHDGISFNKLICVILENASLDYSLSEKIKFS